MANKSILKHNNEERDKQLSNNGISTKDLPESIKDVYSVPQESKRGVLNNNGGNGLKYSYQNKGILKHTYTDEGEYSKKLKEEYGRDLENLNAYTISVVKPSFKVNEYEGANDYISYIDEVYGKKESYFSFLSKLSGVKEAAENLFLDIVNDNEGKNFTDYINEVRKIDDFRYAMEQDAVGIVRNVRPVEALAGVITTNVNKFDGKDTRLGVLSNYYYGRTLVNAAAFNTARNTKYITEELQKTYGLNAANIYDLRPVLSRYVGTNYNDGQYINPFEGAIGDYLKTKITDFRMPSGNGPWMLGYSKDETYFDTVKTGDRWEHNSASQNLRGNEYYSDIDKDFTSEDISTFKGDVITRLSSQNIQVKDKPNILSKTDELFKKKEIKTILGAYYGGEDTDKKPSLIQSGVSERFGVSHGRNLLTKDAYEKGSTIKKGGYDNPYCRVWTYHNQYSKMTDLIRPFINDDKFVSIGELQKNWGIFRTEGATTKLNEFSVLNKNGMVNITPTSDAGDGIGIKNCMFSLENLAWTDETQFLTVDQKGPNGGRIMWFPPYDIEFSESVNVNWETFDFIGRGEPLFAYKNTKRSGTLSFTLLIDNPLILDYWMLDKRNNPTDEDEQTALRFFAGCDTLDPDEDVIRAMDHKDFNGKLDLVEGGEFEKDIIFHTFYPHACYNDYVKERSAKETGELKKNKDKDISDIKNMSNYKQTEEVLDALPNLITLYSKNIKLIYEISNKVRILQKAFNDTKGVELVSFTALDVPSGETNEKWSDELDTPKVNIGLDLRTVNTQKLIGEYKKEGKENPTTISIIERLTKTLIEELTECYKKGQKIEEELKKNNTDRIIVNLFYDVKYDDVASKIKKDKKPNSEFNILIDVANVEEYERVLTLYQKQWENAKKNKKTHEEEIQKINERYNSQITAANRADMSMWYDWYEACLCPYPEIPKDSDLISYWDNGSVNFVEVKDFELSGATTCESTATTCEISFTVNVDWVAEAIKGGTLDVTSGLGSEKEQKVVLTFPINETNKDKVYKVKITAGREKLFVLTQKGKTEAPSDSGNTVSTFNMRAVANPNYTSSLEFIGGKSSIEVESTATTCEISFNTNSRWEVSIQPSAVIDVVQGNAGANCKIQVTLPDINNNEGEGEDGDEKYILTFTLHDGNTYNFTIIHKAPVSEGDGSSGYIRFKDGKTSLSIDATATTCEIEFDAESPWFVQVSPYGKVSPSSGEHGNNQKVQITLPSVNNNEGEDGDETLTVTFTAWNNETYNFTIIHKAPVSEGDEGGDDNVSDNPSGDDDIISSGGWKLKGFLKEKHSESQEYENLINFEDFKNGKYDDIPKYSTWDSEKKEEKKEREDVRSHVSDIESEIRIMAGDDYQLPSDENKYGNFDDDSTLGKIVVVLKELDNTIDDLQERIDDKNEKVDKKQLRFEMNNARTKYSEKYNEYYGYLQALKSKIEQKKLLEKKDDKLSNEINEETPEFRVKIDEIFTGLTTQYGHTNVIYFYYDKGYEGEIKDLKGWINNLEDEISRCDSKEYGDSDMSSDEKEQIKKDLIALKQEYEERLENLKKYGINMECLISTTSATDAYIEYSYKSGFKWYDGLDEAEEKFYYEADDIKICCVEGCCGLTYYKIGCEITEQMPFEKVNSKISFKNMGTDVGYLLVPGRYLVKNPNDGTIMEFKYESDAAKYMRQYKTYTTEEDFLNSKESVCIINGKYGKKVLKEITSDFVGMEENGGYTGNTAVENYIKDIFKSTLEGKKEEDVVNEYFSDKIYNTIKEVKEARKKGELSYGKIQYYFETQMEYPVYESLEDFIIDCRLKIDYFKNDDTFDEQFGFIKFKKEEVEVANEDETPVEYDYRLYRARIEYKNSDNETTINYPSNMTNGEGLGKNRFDLESFGLNTTYELVKKYMGDDTISCSHGEFFVALLKESDNEDDESNALYRKYKTRLIKCEKSCLLKNGYPEEEVEKFITEIETRINTIYSKLKTDIAKDKKNFKIRKVILTSSNGGNEVPQGINDRNNMMESFLKEKVESLKNKTYEKNNIEIENSEAPQEGDEMTKYMDSYSTLEDKKSRNTRLQILFGDFDESKNEEYDHGVSVIKHDVHYGNEQLFFSLLKEQDNVAYRRLVDKVRYFSPAFHSMSPEGFNARLTFLHQCTRQGPTRTISNGSNNANNLAFGRPPICVLKLGDFLNTRVIINSMSISYPDSLWDINPEGIGMQFMMAKVQLGIDILGGSDIDGPIRQLQNALSFNYYANTSLYDVGSNVKNSRNTDVKDKENND